MAENKPSEEPANTATAGNITWETVRQSVLDSGGGDIGPRPLGPRPSKTFSELTPKEQILMLIASQA